MIVTSNLCKRFPVNRATRRKQAKKSNLKDSQDPRRHSSYFEAVRDVSFHCKQGDVLGLLGPNGAGKTTTLRMLSTALQPSSGNITIDGADVVQNPDAARRRLGFLSGNTGLYRRLTVTENIRYMGRLHGMSEAKIQQRTSDLFDRLDMHDFADKRAEDLSTGMRQKAAIARAVIHEPSVIVFDEPTTGLDVMAARTILDFIEEYRNQGLPVIFSTHHLHEVERLCNRVTVIAQGRAVFSDTLDKFRALDPGGDCYAAFVSLIDRESEAVA